MGANSPDPGAVPIGRLRWPVAIATRVQRPDGGTSIDESFEDVQHVRADIQPIGPMTFVGSAQTDTPITHRILLRWLDWIDQRHVVLRRTIRPDGSQRTEVFRIRKVEEIDGRKRFVRLLAEEERRT